MNSLKRKPSNDADDFVLIKRKSVRTRENVDTKDASIVVCVLTKILIIDATKEQRVFCTHI